jgi:hypothetical protein
VSEHDAEGGQGQSHFPGIFQSLVATAIGAGCGPLVTWGWSLAFHRQQPGGTENLISAVTTAVLFLFCWLIWGIAGRLRRHGQHKTPRAEGKRLAIYVAELTVMTRLAALAPALSTPSVTNLARTPWR